MGDWRDDERAAEDLKRNLLIGAVAIAAVAGWMLISRPGDEAPSSRGFNLGGPDAPPSASARPFMPRNQKTGLDFVGSMGADAPAVLPPGAPRDSPPEAAREGSAASAPAADRPLASAAPSAPAPRSPADDARAMASLPTDARGLSSLGAQKGMLSALATKMLDHPNVLKAIFNNKLVVDAFMSRDTSRRNCENAGALKSYLSDANSAGMTKVMPVIQAALSRPETASALAGTEMAKRVMSCPSVEALSKDPGAVIGIAMSNSKAIGLLTDPRVSAALSSNPQASGMLSGVQSQLGGAK